MAHGPVQLSPKGGPLALALILGLISAVLIVIVLRAPSFGLGPGDRSAIIFTVHQALWSAGLSVLLAIPLARALARRRFAGRGLLITLLGAPFLLPVIVAALGLLAVFGQNGWISRLLMLAGADPIRIYGFHGVVLAHVFFNLPLATRLILQGWLAIPAEQFRLAAQLGLTGWGMFQTLEWPVLRKVAPGAFALIFILCLGSFAVALTLGGGPRATTVELAIYEAFLLEFDLGRAAILSMVQLGLSGAAILLAFALMRQIEPGARLDRPSHRWDGNSVAARLGDSAWIGAGFLFLALPLSAIVVAGLPGLLDLPASVWRAALTSIFVASLSTLIMLGLALPIAGWIASRQNGLAEAIGLLAMALSPLMLGTGLFLIVFPFADPGSLAFPVTALVNALLALPFALRTLVPAIEDVLGHQARAMAALGLRGWRGWWIVVLPRIRPQIGFAAGLGAALSMGDLGVVVLFADLGQATLPLQMYRLMGAFRMEAAAGAALVLMLLSFALFWLCDTWGRRAAV